MNSYCWCLLNFIIVCVKCWLFYIKRMCYISDGVCRNTISNCDEYGGKEMCTDTAYKSWAKGHCAEYCGFCTNLYLVKGVVLPDNTTYVTLFIDIYVMKRSM